MQFSELIWWARSERASFWPSQTSAHVNIKPDQLRVAPLQPEKNNNKTCAPTNAAEMQCPALASVTVGVCAHQARTLQLLSSCRSLLLITLGLQVLFWQQQNYFQPRASRGCPANRAGTLTRLREEKLSPLSRIAALPHHELHQGTARRYPNSRGGRTSLWGAKPTKLWKLLPSDTSQLPTDLSGLQALFTHQNTSEKTS